MKTTPQILDKPARIFALTSIGLTAALVSDGLGDLLGWLCLAYVVGIAVRCAFARRRPA